jgi:hypothetical protein
LLYTDAGNIITNCGAEFNGNTQINGNLDLNGNIDVKDNIVCTRIGVNTSASELYPLNVNGLSLFSNNLQCNGLINGLKISSSSSTDPNIKMLLGSMFISPAAGNTTVFINSENGNGGVVMNSGDNAIICTGTGNITKVKNINSQGDITCNNLTADDIKADTISGDNLKADNGVSTVFSNLLRCTITTSLNKRMRVGQMLTYSGFILMKTTVGNFNYQFDFETTGYNIESVSGNVTSTNGNFITHGFGTIYLAAANRVRFDIVFPGILDIDVSVYLHYNFTCFII